MRALSGSLLLLTPRGDHRGGIERIARAVEMAWDGPVARVDLWREQEPRAAVARLVAKVRFAIAAVASAVRSRPGVVLCLHEGQLPVALLASAVSRARTGLVAHGIEVWSPMGPLRRSSIRRCDWILAVSAFTATVLARRARLAPSRISVVPPPIEPAFADDAVEPRRPAEDAESAVDGTLLTVSSLDPGFRYKGHFTIADSLPLLLEDHPRLRWMVVGDGADLPALRTRCAELGVLGSVDFLGSVADGDLRDAYRQADLLVLPSSADPDAIPPEGEGFGIAYAEAGAYAVPSIGSTAAGGASDFVIDGETGLTVPPHDPQALARATEQLLADSTLREQLGEAARERVLARHLPAHFRTAMSQALTRC